MQKRTNLSAFNEQFDGATKCDCGTQTLPQLSRNTAAEQNQNSRGQNQHPHTTNALVQLSCTTSWSSVHKFGLNRTLPLPVVCKLTSGGPFGYSETERKTQQRSQASATETPELVTRSTLAMFICFFESGRTIREVAVEEEEAKAIGCLIWCSDKKLAERHLKRERGNTSSNEQQKFKNQILLAHVLSLCVFRSLTASSLYLSHVDESGWIGSDLFRSAAAGGRREEHSDTPHTTHESAEFLKRARMQSNAMRCNAIRQRCFSVFTVCCICLTVFRCEPLDPYAIRR
jgi:hypothetical protein